MTTVAEEKTKELPGDTTLPSSAEELQRIIASSAHQSRYSVEDFFKSPDTAQYYLSPSGKYLAFRRRNEKGRMPILVRELGTQKEWEVANEDGGIIHGFHWKNDERILFTRDQDGNENTQLFVAHVDEPKVINLTPFEGVRATELKVLKKDPDHVAVNMNKEKPEFFFPYLVNIHTGDIQPLLDLSLVETTNVQQFLCDQDSKIRLYGTFEGNISTLYYRSKEQQDFEKVISVDWKETFHPVALDQSAEDIAYVYTDLASDTANICRYDLKNKQVVETIYHDDRYDLYHDYSGPELSFSVARGGELDALEYFSDTYKVVPLTPWFEQVDKRINAAYPNHRYAIFSRDDQDKYLVLALFSGSQSPIYVLYDIREDRFEEVAQSRPHLKVEEMGTVTPIAFTSRDGLSIEGYLCRPAGAEGATPLIVNPHGGPYGIRDVYWFNTEMQLFASRGFATLQINYRGSGGYGKKHWKSGFNQVGRKMLDDLEDGVQYAFDQGWTTPGQVAIYGASYGGLATLGSLVKTPDLYTCGVNYVGVSNLFTFYKAIPPYWKPMLDMLREQWYDYDDAEHQEIMKAASPALNADRISKPLFVVQGANDPRVNIDESDQIVRELRSRGFDVPYLVKYNEGHGFAKEENKLELYHLMLGFLSRHLKTS